MEYKHMDVDNNCLTPVLPGLFACLLDTNPNIYPSYSSGLPTWHQPNIYHYYCSDLPAPIPTLTTYLLLRPTGTNLSIYHSYCSGLPAPIPTSILLTNQAYKHNSQNLSFLLIRHTWQQSKIYPYSSGIRGTNLNILSSYH